MSEKDPNVFLAHARDCPKRITAYAAEGEAVFLSDRKTQDAILRNLEILGQCVKDAGVDYLASPAPTIASKKIADFRNVLAHAYLSVKPETVWVIVRSELPSVKASIDKLLEKWQP